MNSRSFRLTCLTCLRKYPLSYIEKQLRYKAPLSHFCVLPMYLLFCVPTMGTGHTACTLPHVRAVPPEEPMPVPWSVQFWVWNVFEKIAVAPKLSYTKKQFPICLCCTYIANPGAVMGIDDKGGDGARPSEAYAKSRSARAPPHWNHHPKQSGLAMVTRARHVMNV